MTDTIARGLAVQAKAANKSVEIDVATHSATLTAAESFAARITFKGVMTNSLTFVLDPASARAQSIKNSTTGAFDLSVKRGSGGAALVIPQNETVEVR